MVSRSKLFIDSMALASFLAVIDIVIAFVCLVIDPTSFVLLTTSTLLFMEFGVLLVLGGCLMAREPLDDSKKHDEDGNPVTAWKLALYGRRFLLGSFFAFMYSIMFYFLGLFI